MNFFKKLFGKRTLNTSSIGKKDNSSRNRRCTNCGEAFVGPATVLVGSGNALLGVVCQACALKNKAESQEVRQGFVKIAFDESEQELLKNCSGALGVQIREVDVQFTDGTLLANATVAIDSVEIPTQYAGRPIEFIGIPLEQGVKVREKGYAARSVRSNRNIILGTTVLMWMMKDDAKGTE